MASTFPSFEKKNNRENHPSYLLLAIIILKCVSCSLYGYVSNQVDLFQPHYWDIACNNEKLWIIKANEVCDECFVQCIYTKHVLLLITRENGKNELILFGDKNRLTYRCVIFIIGCDYFPSFSFLFLLFHLTFSIHAPEYYVVFEISLVFYPLSFVRWTKCK